jgi:hypothetical protein
MAVSESARAPERRSFDPESTRLVAGLLLIYGMGIVPSLVRDVMVRFFYRLGDGGHALPRRPGRRRHERGP